MEFSPKVSIIIPVYNGANYLREAIDSALAQTYKNTEIIVVNDGSKDNGKTEEIALSYGDQIRYLYKENGGVASALNCGIFNMTGEYFSWLSHDDVYYPQKIELQIKAVEKEEHPVIIYSDFDCIDYKSDYIRTYRVEEIDSSIPWYDLIVSSPIHGCTVLIPKICFDTVGLFNEQLRSTQDVDIWFRMVKNFQFKHLPEILIKSRYHDEQGSFKILSHRDECNHLYITYVKKIHESSTLQDIPSLSRFYIELAFGLTKKELFEAASAALKISKTHLKQDLMLVRLINKFYVLGCRISFIFRYFRGVIVSTIRASKLGKKLIILLKRSIKKEKIYNNNGGKI